MSRRRSRIAARAAPTVELDRTSIPRATYRVQLHSDFTFRDATALVPYLAQLGISHLYCSPYLRARPGSRHGYDVVDHGMLNPEIGSREDFDAMVTALRRHGMHHLCDVVPNHMAIFGQDNAWWMDVLENGPASPYADHFDIDWTPADPSLAGKVLVPVLGDAYGTVLERGELVLGFERDNGTFAVRYFDHRFPLDPSTCAGLLDRAPAVNLLDDEPRTQLRAIADAMRTLPPANTPHVEALALRRREAPAIKARLAQAARNDAIAAAIDTAVAQANGESGRPESFDDLHALLEAQSFRLAHWRVASDEINYRRFFDVNELASLRMENDDAFEATHGFVLRLAAEGRIGGLRVDHPDGLRDPAAYFARLQSRYRELVAERTGQAVDAVRGLYVVIEKISAAHERLPSDWAVHGDTGYPFANAINAVLIDATAHGRIDRVWRAFTGEEARDFEEAMHDGKRAIMHGSLAAGLHTLATQALRLARELRRTRDFTLFTLREALAETVAWFPVYRTYVTARGRSPQDERYIDWAISRARRASRVADPSVFDFIRSLLLAGPPEGAPEALRERYLDFAMRFQQFTSPVAAKGVEDTAFYTHTRFVSLNDVGGEPGHFGMTRRAFHRVMADRAAAWPHTLLATSTHDSKRSEDVRARLDVISELPAAWRLLVRRWSRLNRSRKSNVGGQIAPSRSDEYLLYQTLVASFPPESCEGAALDAYRERIVAYMIKAAREAKRQTSWLRNDPDYENALTTFVEALLANRSDNRFLEDLRAQAATTAWFGALNSITLALVKACAPGVPDIYQGNELIDYSLVDPDNRRPVDYAKRWRLLDELLHRAQSEVANAAKRTLEHPFEGTAKLWTLARILRFRSEHRELFDDGDYRPIAATGSRSRHVLAFARTRDAQGLVAVAGRLFASIGTHPGTLPLGEPVWGDTTIEAAAPSEATVTNLLTGERVVAQDGRWRLSQLFAIFPGAVLAWT